MKAAAFEYVSPATVEEVVALLARTDGAKILSGGQSLIPILAFRLSAPPLLIDLKNVSGLNRIDIADGVIVGSRVRWVDIERDHRLNAAHPLLAAAISHVAHYQVRNRGTAGGSVAHADPAAEMPGVAVTCEAQIETRSTRGVRRIAAEDFFLGPLDTALEPDELIVAIHLPAWPDRRRWGFREFARRRGDFALAGVLLFYDEDNAGGVCNAHVGAIGVGDRPQRLHEVEHALNGRQLDDEAIALAASAAEQAIDPRTDLHASGPYRRSLYCTLLKRALRQSKGLEEP